MATPEPCPASLPLCPCGKRGCELAEEHHQVFVVLPRRRHRGWRRPSGGSR